MARVATTAGDQGAEGNGVIAREHNAAFELRWFHFERAALGHVLLHVGLAQVDSLEVLVKDVLALFGQLRLAQQAVNVLDV